MLNKIKKCLKLKLEEVHILHAITRGRGGGGGGREGIPIFEGAERGKMSSRGGGSENR